MFTNIKNYFAFKAYQSEVTTSTKGLDPWEKALFGKYERKIAMRLCIYLFRNLSQFTYSLPVHLFFYTDSLILVSITLLTYTTFATLPDQMLSAKIDDLNS